MAGLKLQKGIIRGDVSTNKLWKIYNQRIYRDLFLTNIQLICTLKPDKLMCDECKKGDALFHH